MRSDIPMIITRHLFPFYPKEGDYIRIDFTRYYSAMGLDYDEIDDIIDKIKQVFNIDNPCHWYFRIYTVSWDIAPNGYDIELEVCMGDDYTIEKN